MVANTIGFDITGQISLDRVNQGFDLTRGQVVAIAYACKETKKWIGCRLFYTLSLQ
jgi:hypothetical protein